MHVGIFTLGSRGDVQPYIALALGLKKRGHEVTLAASENFKEFVESYGIKFHSIFGDTEEVINAPEGLRLLKSGNDLALLKFLAAGHDKVRHTIAKDLMLGCQQVDYIITSYIPSFTIATIAEKLNKPWVIVNVSPPFIKTYERPAMNFTLLDFPLYNRLTYRIADWVQWHLNKKAIKELRAQLDLPPLNKPLTQLIKEQKILTLHAISTQLYPRPNDWAPQYQLTSFMTIPSEVRETHPYEQMAPALVAWLKKGEKPLYIGFGSIPFPDPELFIWTLQEILKSGTRVIFVKGWFKINKLPEHHNLFVLQSANHERLMPLCKAAVIHGGIGTLTAVLRAKIVPIIVSIFADQPYWGKIIAKNGIGIHMRWKKISASKILSALSGEKYISLLNKASDVGSKIHIEDGVTMTINSLVEHDQRFHGVP
ncbi:MAG TPA: glycosyltransferase [Cytophagales bacterium]|nr:glycosyltransferase [Cytophagales bacterium]